ncbi:hypothetical protein MHPYR_310078 [uncultured Mycobacterium sp.]|uniref:Uncharacterized protein n=1 Tax=uncultured Mycobacterium sp. TaxID=171292 RepID=A0A1Y5PCH2_9MYCO|nr:hypothetical protein MHPYR_310078 [uncultured Mycobacterium sp.]
MTDWIPFSLDFLKPGEYEYHRYEGWIRDSQRKRLTEYLSDDRMACVDVKLATGGKLRLRKALLFALQLHGRKDEPAELDREIADPYYLMQIDRLRELGWPFNQCQYCGLPIPAAVEQRAIVGFRGVLVGIWNAVRWYFDTDRLETHETMCLAELMVVPAYYTPAPRATLTDTGSDGKPQTRPHPSVRNRVHH